jgi:S-adenosylmethionine/arginine decarboxylase-like enzyme
MILIHKHLIARCEIKNPPRSESEMNKWMKGFVKSIGMKILKGPYSKYCTTTGNEGMTSIAVIETSHIAFHIWDGMKPALMQVDVYSCADFDPKEVCKTLTEYFDIVKMDIKLLNRETGLEPIYVEDL